MQQKQLIWDLPLRIFHWLLVLLIFSQWLLTKLDTDYFNWHFYLGYTTLGLMLFRLIWGIVGPTHARFASFVKGPKNIIAYIKGQSLPYPGHNPLGALMVLTMLGLVLLQALSGLFTDDDMFYVGPYKDAISSSIQQSMQWLHHNVFDWLLICIGLHIAANIWYQTFKKQKIINAMFTGKKESDETQAIAHSKLWLAIGIVLAVSLAVFLLVYFAPVPADDWY